MSNPSRRAMLCGQYSKKTAEEVWDDIQATTATVDWDIDTMLDEDTTSVNRFAADD
ncbi:hypothetical protein [Haloarcula laminariae]|uniref:hypothetical protein n=1 Tax=Haloarcula laminariae TaxID=2961577 RepID=UPI002407068B|nr:hypothetical protein [Halomicroarcula sp. FL173]